MKSDGGDVADEPESACVCVCAFCFSSPLPPFSPFPHFLSQD